MSQKNNHDRDTEDELLRLGALVAHLSDADFAPPSEPIPWQIDAVLNVLCVDELTIPERNGWKLMVLKAIAGLQDRGFAIVPQRKTTSGLRLLTEFLIELESENFLINLDGRYKVTQEGSEHVLQQAGVEPR